MAHERLRVGLAEHQRDALGDVGHEPGGSVVQHHLDAAGGERGGHRHARARRADDEHAIGQRAAHRYWSNRR